MKWALAFLFALNLTAFGEKRIAGGRTYESSTAPNWFIIRGHVVQDMGWGWVAEASVCQHGTNKTAWTGTIILKNVPKNYQDYTQRKAQYLALEKQYLALSEEHDRLRSQRAELKALHADQGAVTVSANKPTLGDVRKLNNYQDTGAAIDTNYERIDATKEKLTVMEDEMLKLKGSYDFSEPYPFSFDAMLTGTAYNKHPVYDCGVLAK